MLCTAILYSHALQNELTSFDDDFYITRNPYLRDFSWEGAKAIFSSFYTSNYHPLTTLTYFLEFHFFGLDPFPYHLANVVLHVLNTWLVYKVTEELSGKRLTALIVSVLFAMHPMHVESVAWVAERKDVLYAFFYLSSLWAYLRYIAADGATKYYVVSLLLFICSVLSKSTAVTLPVVFIIVDIYKGRKITMRTLLEKAPFLVLSLVFGILNIMAQSAGGSINTIASSLGLGNRIFLITAAISSYLFRLVVPYYLCGIHYFPVLNNGFLPFYYYLSLPFVAIIVWFVLRRSAFRKELVFGSSFFLVSVLLMLQIVSVGSALTAERYTYISYIGLFYIFGQWVSSLEAIKWKKITIGCFMIVSMIYSSLSWARIGVWQNDIILFGDMIEKYPNVYFGYWMMGNFEKKEGNMQSALQNYNRSIELFPGFDDSYYNRGALHDAMGNVKNAVQDYTTCIMINPKSADAYNNRGWDKFQSGDTTAALQDLDMAISLKPDYYEAYNNRGWVLFSGGDMKKAINNFNLAIQINGGYAKARYNRAAAEGNMGNFKAALTDYNTLIALNPDDNMAYYYRAITFLNIKDTASACADLQKSRQAGNTGADAAIRQFCH